MSAVLSPQLSEKYLVASNREAFFDKDFTKQLDNFEQREQPPICKPGISCTTNLFFGFFFDGTKNNYIQAESSKTHSNVARLYDCYPGRSVPRVLPPETDWKHNPARYTHFFKVYIPGVSSPFEQVGDSGTGLAETAGGAGGKMGEHRIIWALIQAINNLHRYFLGTPLVTDEETTKLLKRIMLNKRARSMMVGPNPAEGVLFQSLVFGDAAARVCFENILKKLHGAIALHRPDKRSGRPARLDPAIVKTIYVSAFGYSRGATQARAFTNWFLSLCELDAQLLGTGSKRSLGGFPVEFDFLGVFDTVASVGMGNTLGGTTGHGAWADSEDSLRIQSGIKCTHLVAAHELRRSFPVDSISVQGVLPDGCQEMVLPGVHSDVGCGYAPTEQGKGTHPDGDDMLARIPLLLMYKAARLNGVPLKLELANPLARRRFALKPDTITAFNAYIATCKEKQGPLHRIMREQARKQMEWRIFRRASGKNAIQNSQSFMRATTFDKNDLYSAAREFEEEILKFLKWPEKKGRAFVASTQVPGFRNEHQAEWEEIATWWDKVAAPPTAVVDFFDNYVHDSRAWFKLFSVGPINFNPDSEAGAHKQLKAWVTKRKHGQAKVVSPMLIGKADYATVSDLLSPDQQAAADEYAKTGQIPRMITAGREPWESSFGWLAGAGYLRFRKIYAGSDAHLLSSLAPQDDPEGLPTMGDEGRTETRSA